MNNENQVLELSTLQSALKDALKEVAVPLEKIDFTKENYNSLFPRGRIETPIENVKLGVNQFEKLEEKERQNLLLAVHDTLKNPDLIINEQKENVFGEQEDSHLYAKSFLINDKVHGIQSVVVSIDGENVSISTHERDINNIVNKIKKPDQLLYAAAKVRLLVEQHTEIPQSVVNPIRENEYVVSPTSNIQQQSESVKLSQEIATELVLEKLKQAKINVITEESAMQSILSAGIEVQKMAAHYGTNQNIENSQSFNGYGVYVLSVNEENAKTLGLKIASKKYGNSFYINNQPLQEFLQERNFSPYWQSVISQIQNPSTENLLNQILTSDVKGNQTLLKEQSQLSTLCSLNLINYKREQTYLYSVEIPDNDGTNYLFYDKTIGLENANRINEELKKIGSEWKVSRNDTGNSVYFNILSDKVFNSQKQASEFLQKIGYVGMETSSSNYIIFDDREMNINNRVQYMMSENGEVYGFAYNGEIYADKNLMNSNVLAHEYTHLWDNYTKNANPELWERGKNIFKQTNVWNEVVNDPSYQNIKNNEDEILSECHARICGKFAQQVLERIASEYGENAKNAVIDWDSEVNEFVAKEFGFVSELGSENYVSDSIKAEKMKEFLASPMKDLMAGRGFEKQLENGTLSLDNAKKAFPGIVDLSDEFSSPAPTEKEVLAKLRSMVGEVYATTTEGKSLQVAGDREKLSHIFEGNNYIHDNNKVRKTNRRLANNVEKLIRNAKFIEAELPDPKKNKDYLLGMHNYEVPVFVNGHGFTVRLEGEVIKTAPDYSLSHKTTKKTLTSEAEKNVPEFSPGNETLKKTPASGAEKSASDFSSGNETLEKILTSEAQIDTNELLLKLQAAQVSNLYVVRKQRPLFKIEKNQQKNMENKTMEKGKEPNQEDYIHSEEFISKFGDWEKANRIEKLRNAETIVGSSKITVSGSDITDLVERLRSEYSVSNLKQLQNIAKDIGKEVISNYRKKQNLDEYSNLEFKNFDIGENYKLQWTGIKEIKGYNIFQKGHIEAIRLIPEIIENGVYIGKEPNEDGRNPNLKEFYYFASGLKIDSDDYTVKSVFVKNDKGQIFYDQSLSSIEKGKFVDIIQQKNKPETVNLVNTKDSFEPNKLGNLSHLIATWESEPLENKSPSAYYDKRLINICQVPQMPYLEMKNGKWQPKEEAIQAVKEGKLFIEKNGQNYTMHDENVVENEENEQSQNHEKESELSQWYETVDWDDPIESAEAWQNGTQEQIDYIQKRQNENHEQSEISEALSNKAEEQILDSVNYSLYLPKHKWSENLKEVITNTSYQSMIDNRELQIEGKSGNEEAAVELVSKLVDDKIVSELVNKYPNAIVVPIPSMETADKKPNAIPFAYARKFEKAGLQIANDIIEIDSAHHTGKKSFKRVVNRPHFDGTIEQGKEYIIVDDVFAMGGTINSMKNFIEDKGGIVVAVSTLTPSVENSKILAITDENLNLLKSIDKKGTLLNAIRKLDIAENFEALTDPIGKYIVNNREKIINEERTRRAQSNSKTNAKQNQRNKQITSDNFDHTDPIESLEQIAYIQKRQNENHEQSANIIDNGIENLQANGGMSDAAIKADIENLEKSEISEALSNKDEEQSAEIDILFEDTNGNPHYPQEIISVLENFQKIESSKWNLKAEEKTAVFHLIQITEIGKNDFENSLAKLKDYMNSEEFKKEESNYAKILTPILLTSLGQDFDEKTHTFSSTKFSYKFSTDDLEKEVSVEKNLVEKGEIKSVLGNDFTGGNVKLTQDFQNELIEKKIVKPEEKFILINEVEAVAYGTKVKQGEPFVTLTIPVDYDGKTEFVQTKYYHVSSLEEPQKIEKLAKDNTKEEKQTDKNIIIYGETKVPEFAMITQHGLENFKDMIVESYEESTKTYLLKSKDNNQNVRISENTLNTLRSENYAKKAENYSQNTKTAEKMVETQYEDFFKLRSNCANNFRHNLAIFCRKEANSPLDALKLANSLISQMPKDEKRKTKELLNLLKKDGQSVNEVIIETYHEAVKEVPLNEDYLNNKRYEKIIARPMYDTISTKGEKIDRDFNLKIGDSVQMSFKVNKNPSSKFSLRKEKLNQNCTIISASKEGNLVTVMDGNKSFYDVPRDTFLKEYAKRQKVENKMEKKTQRKISMQIDIGR